MPAKVTVLKTNRDHLAIETENRTNAHIRQLEREVDSLRAEVRSQAARLAALRPQQPELPFGGCPAWAAAFERRLDVLAAEMARISSAGGVSGPRKARSRVVGHPRSGGGR